MAAARPFASVRALRDKADEIWWALSPADWREAFAAHPRIGDVASLRRKFASTASWAAGEQAGAAGASEATLSALAEGNDAYFAKFGFIFIISASGKTADEMLAALRARLSNDAERELRIAAEQQLEITHLRLEKLMASKITTHVLDTSIGKPAAGVEVTLEALAGEWRELGRGKTDADGRIVTLLAGDATLALGAYRLSFATGDYFQRAQKPTFFPRVAIVFEVADAAQHYHVPLLVSPFGYSTYRGS
jgi:5-hydroxyisourate hydrolase/2-oxo-4-hydroxy-4-carboxy-5-ureidoimidazoline decarboxylase